jgi:hypothetical protein
MVSEQYLLHEYQYLFEQYLLHEYQYCEQYLLHEYYMSINMHTSAVICRRACIYRSVAASVKRSCGSNTRRSAV